ncbi:MAG: hypothetical protein COU51_01055 [Parcubacteria group bacterium CG10_big_fil_rev_8_21_14_0_10_36_14]|nr:MAG: hypothetical protein COU51_01055 [Parcubacteria group bacterium CG10_big_fil_rev_8_21_14_0_10_36_14]
MKKFKAIFKNILKNIGVFLFGGIIGIIFSLVLMKGLLVISISKDVGLGIIALAPIFMIFWIIALGFFGGVMAIIIYQLIRFLKKYRKK